MSCEHSTHLSEELQEVVDVGGAHGLGNVALALEMVLTGIGGTHPQAVEGTLLQSATTALK